MKIIVVALTSLAMVYGEDLPSLWRDPGPVESLDLAGGPGGAANVPKPPFSFVKVEGRGFTPKVVVTDSRGMKWMVKFGQEAKAEAFASRLAWAAGYPARASYYVESGQIAGIPDLKEAGQSVGSGGSFHNARFQAFDDEKFHEVKGGKLDLKDKRLDKRELNGLKLAVLLLANWDVKPSNTAVFEIEGKRYATVSDWGASLGDPASQNRDVRKWDCKAYAAITPRLVEGVDNGYVQFNYDQYAGRHIDAVSTGIRLEDVRWFVDRLNKLSGEQLRAGLRASGASAEETDCFANAIRKRLDMLSTLGTQTSTTTTTTTTK